MANVVKVGSATLSTPVNGSIAGATARPYNLSTYNVDDGLTLDIVEQKLRMASTLSDIFMGISDPVVYVGEKIMVPNDVVMKLSFDNGAKTATLPIDEPLTGPARQGTSEEQLGYERDTTLKYLKVYYNEYSQAMTESKWGVNYNDLNKFGFYAKIQPKLSKYFQELHGRHYREALLETYSEPLTKAGASLTQHWNPNWFLPNTQFDSQPSYDSTLADFSQNIATAMAAADSGTSGVDANISLNYFIDLEEYASTTLRIDPLVINGNYMYVATIPSRQWALLKKNQAGQLGQVFVDASGLTKEEMMYPGIIGKIGNILIAKDDRYPTFECDTYTTPTVTTEYVNPGNDDSRNKTVYNESTNLAWDIGFLLGKAAIWDWTVKDLHFESDSTEYGKIQARGGFTERGIGLAINDVDSADQTDSTRTNYGSCVLAFTAISLVS